MSDQTSNLSVRSRLFRGYGPMVCLLASVLAVSLAVPSRVPDRTVATGPASTDYEIPGVETTPDDAVAGTAPSEVASGDSTTSVPTDVAGTATERAGTGGSAAGPGAAANRGAPAAGVPGSGVGPNTAPAGCSGGARHLAGVDYSPACKPWPAGANNGGATSPGVTANTITVSVRQNAFVNELLNLLADAASASTLKEDMAKTTDTLNALVAYFNNTYHFYGRKLVLAPYNGVGSGQDELFGAGVAGATADATKVERELKAFADISGITLPYADQLSRRRIINVGAPYPSKQWLEERGGFTWTPADCSTVATTAASYYVSRLAGRPAARAGGNLAGQQRRVAVLAPNDASYKACVEQAIRIIEDAGLGADVVAKEFYRLDFNDLVNQAAILTPKIVNSGATTIFCGCDPVMLLFLSGQINRQGYEPEWISTGVAYVDQDLVGQLMNPNQWRRAFGVSFNGPTEGLRSSEAFDAYASIKGNVPASIGLEAMYYQLQMLAIGIMQAGPNLTPETFRQGMYEFPAASGRAGKWDFAPGDYSTADDAREIYWAPSANSEQNGRQGAWIDPAPGTRYAIGRWPSGEPALPAP